MTNIYFVAVVAVVKCENAKFHFDLLLLQIASLVGAQEG